MTRGARFTFLAIAVVIAIVAIVVLADSSEDDSGSQTAATATPTETAAPTEASPAEEETPTATPTPPPPPLLTANKVTELEATQGETVRFRARSATDDEVHVHGYDISEEAPAGETITMSFKADITGIFEIEFEAAGKEIGKLTVEP
jgi:FtsP/CotA-like multicopper oxidase with cupredoxin domain